MAWGRGHVGAPALPPPRSMAVNLQLCWMVAILTQAPVLYGMRFRSALQL